MTDEKLTDFTDTSDVSDAAIEWVLQGPIPGEDPQKVRRHASSGYAEDRAAIIAARLIEQYRPDLLVDPVDAVVRDVLHDEGLCPVDIGYVEAERVAKRLYLMGIEKGRSDD